MRPLTDEEKRECAALKALFKEKSPMTQREFVKVHDFGTPANLNQYLMGRRAISLKLAVMMSKALSVPISDFSPRLALEYEAMKPDSNVSALNSIRRIPVLSRVQAGAFTSTGQVANPEACIESGDFLYASGEMPDGTFALRVQGDSMTPDFNDGDWVVVDPGRRALPGDVVIAGRTDPITEDYDITMKKYREVGYSSSGAVIFELVPENPNYPVIRSDVLSCEVIGVVIEHRRVLKRY